MSELLMRLFDLNPMDASFFAGIIYTALAAIIIGTTILIWRKSSLCYHLIHCQHRGYIYLITTRTRAAKSIRHYLSNYAHEGKSWPTSLPEIENKIGTQAVQKAIKDLKRGTKHGYVTLRGY